MKKGSISGFFCLVLIVGAMAQLPEVGKPMPDFTLPMDAIMTDWKEVRAALNANGLDLVKGTRLMKVLIIRDPPNESIN
jgi:hypothetical protein